MTEPQHYEPIHPYPWSLSGDAILDANGEPVAYVTTEQAGQVLVKMYNNHPVQIVKQTYVPPDDLLITPTTPSEPYIVDAEDA